MSRISKPQANLKDFVDGLISVYAKWTEQGYDLNFDDLSTDEKEAFAVYCLQIDIAEKQELDWLINANTDIIMNHFCNSLLAFNPERTEFSEKFQDALRERLVEYYEPGMRKLLEEELQDKFASEHKENEFYPKQDPITGETYYSKY